MNDQTLRLLLVTRVCDGETFITDTQTDIPTRGLVGAMCVQRFDDSLRSAIHITYRISLRSSSLREPRHPLLKVVLFD